MLTTQLNQISGEGIEPNHSFFPEVGNIYLDTAKQFDELYDSVFSQGEPTFLELIRDAQNIIAAKIETIKGRKRTDLGDTSVNDCMRVYKQLDVVLEQFNQL